MTKNFLYLLAAAGIMSFPNIANAQHFQSSVNPVVFTGQATLNTYSCNLTLTATLDDTHGSAHTSVGLYNLITKITGTNTPNPSPACTFIRILDGDGVVSSYTPGGGAAGLGSGTITINNLEILPGTPPNCNTGSFTAAVENTSATTVKITVSAPSTGCGNISAVLTGNGQITS